MAALHQGKSGERLESWKEIAVFFDRDRKTVQRWEKDLGLPVHRLPGVSKGRVYAFAQELADWAQQPCEASIEVAFETGTGSVEPLLLLVPSADTNLLNKTNEPSRFLPLHRTFVITALAVLFVGTIGFSSRKFSLASPAVAPPLANSQGARHAPNPEAERLYLEGRYYWNQRTAAGLTQALDDFTQAIVLDPQDAKAYAGLADSYDLIREYSAIPEDEAFPRAETAARKAIELDPNLAEGHRALAFPLFWWRHDFAIANREFQRAIALSPNDATAHLWYANVLKNAGENERAVEEINRAQELDPSSSSIRADKGLILYGAGRREEALSLLRQMKKNEPAFLSPHNYLAQIYWGEHDYPDYLQEAEDTARLSNRPDELELVAAEKKGLAQGGASGFLEGMLGVQKKLYAQEKIPAYPLAQTAALLGKKAEALQYLMASLSRHERRLVDIATDTTLLSLHDEPTFKQLTAEVGLPAPTK
jgi:uncharacterized protein (TIGR02996 family)